MPKYDNCFGYDYFMNDCWSTMAPREVTIEPHFLHSNDKCYAIFKYQN